MNTLKKRTMVSLISASLLLGWVFLVASSLCGGVPTQEDGIERALSESQMAFYGEVSNVKYRLSRDGTPHAFVTYRIKKIIRGQQIRGEDKTETVTLRFIGGPRGNGTFLTVSGVPNFNVGDQDVLLVRNNGEAQCPLVGYGYGRFRILNDRVYNSEGIPVIGVREERIVAAGRPEPKLQLIRFPAPTFDEVYKREDVQEYLQESGREVDLDELRKRYEEEAPKEIILEPTFPAPKADGEKTEPMSLEVFIEILAEKARGLKDEPKPVESLDPDKPFTFKLPVVSTPMK